MSISKLDLLNAALAAVGPQEKYLEEDRKSKANLQANQENPQPAVPRPAERPPAPLR